MNQSELILKTFSNLVPIGNNVRDLRSSSHFLGRIPLDSDTSQTSGELLKRGGRARPRVKFKAAHFTVLYLVRPENVTHFGFNDSATLEQKWRLSN